MSNLDRSMNISLYGSRSLTACSQKGHTGLKIQPQMSLSKNNVGIQTSVYIFKRSVPFTFVSFVCYNQMSLGPMVLG